MMKKTDLKYFYIIFYQIEQADRDNYQFNNALSLARSCLQVYSYLNKNSKSTYSSFIFKNDDIGT